MWYRTIIIVTIITLGLISTVNIPTASFAKNVVSDCPSGFVYEKVLEDGIWWMYVYCDGALVDKYIVDE